MENQHSVVQLFRYVTDGNFDAYMWRTLETKVKFITQMMSGDMTVRRLEDSDSAALTCAMVKSIASGSRQLACLQLMISSCDCSP